MTAGAGPIAHDQPLELRLLGPFEVRVAGRPIGRLHSRKGLWLLALLALRHGRPVEREWLAGTLWPDSTEAGAFANLRNCLFDVRGGLGAEAARLSAPTSHTVCLDLVGAYADIVAFDSALASSDSASLYDAVSLYRGPVLEGCTEEWILVDREAREQAYLQALETLAQAAIRSGNPGEAVSLLRQVIAVDILRESAQRALMLALSQDGDEGALVRTYRDLRLHLRRELNTEPSGETSALFHELRERTPPCANAPRLRPAVSNIGLRTPSLPIQFTRFFGREEEIDRLESLLTNTTSNSRLPRLISLTGSGGSGKTRLAIEAAERLMEAFAGALWFVGLAELTDSRAIMSAIVDAMHLSHSATLDPTEQVIRHLIEQAGPAVLILDNCEHRISEVLPVVKTLLERVPALAILTTSRQSMNLECELEFPVPPLPTPERRTLKPDDLTHYASVQLFVDRARARRPSFQLSEQNAGAVSELCDRLEGIPLAIELAAGWAKTLTPQEILSQLGRRFEILISHRTDYPPRHRSLHAALEWSYQLLAPELRQFFVNLSVFRGGWTAEAARTVAGSELPQTHASERLSTLDHLAQFIERSLVVAEEHGNVTRYRMLETLREFGWEVMSTEERNRVQEQHADYFLRWTQEAGPKFKGAEQTEWIEWAETEHDNIRAALTWKMDREPRSALRMAAVMHRFWFVRGHLYEGREWLRAAIFHPESAGRTEDRVRALNAAGSLAQEQGDYTTARGYYNEALDIRRDLGDQRGIARSLNVLGTIAQEQGNVVSARETYEEGLRIASELGDTWAITSLRGNLGGVARDSGDYTSARSLLEESLALETEMRDLWGIANALGNLGSVAYCRRDYCTAYTLIVQSLTMWQELENIRCIAESLEGVARVLVAVALPMSDYSIALLQRAASLWGTAATLRGEIGAPLLPCNREEHEQVVTKTRTALGIEQFAEAWAEGQIMTLAQAIKLASSPLELGRRQTAD
jgi:Predicted ATPase